jgi:hypothetical protein
MVKVLMAAALMAALAAFYAFPASAQKEQTLPVEAENGLSPANTHSKAIERAGSDEEFSVENVSPLS